MGRATPVVAQLARQSIVAAPCWLRTTLAALSGECAEATMLHADAAGLLYFRGRPRECWERTDSGAGYADKVQNRRRRNTNSAGEIIEPDRPVHLVARAVDSGVEGASEATGL